MKTPDYFLTIGGKIRLLRVMHGMSQMELADIMHVTQSVVCRWEKNQTEPDAKTIIILAQLFQVQLTLLVDEKRPLK